MILTTEEWVRRLNKLAREMAVWENSLHPSAWAEQNAELIRKWKELAAVGYRVPASAFKAIDRDLGCASGQG